MLWVGAWLVLSSGNGKMPEMARTKKNAADLKEKLEDLEDVEEGQEDEVTAESAEETGEVRKCIPIEVFVEGDNVERALKALKRKLIREGVFKEYKAKRYFEKPSVKRKRKRNETLRKIERIERERLASLQLIK